jgi:hypothetical protein
MADRMLVVALAVLLSLGVLATPAGGQDAGTTTTTIGQVPTQDIVPAPNQGAEPEDAGDRGGALQLGLLALLVGAVGTVVVMVIRQSRRARDAVGPR